MVHAVLVVPVAGAVVVVIVVAFVVVGIVTVAGVALSFLPSFAVVQAPFVSRDA